MSERVTADYQSAYRLNSFRRSDGKRRKARGLFHRNNKQNRKGQNANGFGKYPCPAVYYFIFDLLSKSLTEVNIYENKS